MQPIKVLHIYAGNLFGGLENLLVSLAALRGLCPQIEPEFALCFEGRLSSELRATGATVHHLGKVRFSRPWTVWAARMRLRTILENSRPDAVICHECWPHNLAASEVRRFGATLAFWMHGWVVGSWLEKRAKKYPPDYAVTTSRYSASMLPQLFPGVPSGVIHPIIAPPQFDHETTRRSYREKLQVQPSDVVVAVTSRIVRYKGHDLLLKALGKLREIPNWILWIAGDPQRPEEEVYLMELRTLATDLGIDARIHFLGQRTDIPQVLAGADIHCQPNRGAEPFGLAFVEALYARLPVVTTRIGGAIEIVDDTCGRLVGPNDVEALATVLKELIIDQATRQNLGKGGPPKARALCDPTTNLARLAELLAIAIAPK
jgi:glycosyltransferase involved in cell wall biosynthesis